LVEHATVAEQRRQAAEQQQQQQLSVTSSPRSGQASPYLMTTDAIYEDIDMQV